MKNKEKNILWLGLVSFINDASSKIILPILPLFIKELGGTGWVVGLISGLGESTASLFKMLAGAWSDQLGERKPFVLAGYTVSSGAKFLFTLATGWPQVLILKVMERLGKGLRSAPRDAILAVSTKKSRRGRGFGLHRAMDSGGSVLGSLLTFFLFWYFNLSFQKIFLVAGVIAFLSLIPLGFVKEKGKQERIKNFNLFSLESLSPPLKLFIIVATLFALANFSYMFFVLKSQDFFVGKLATGIPILLYALYNTSYTLFALPAGILSDKIGRRYVLLFGYGLFGLVCLGFIFSQSLPFFGLFFVLLGLNYALVNANQRAFVSDLAPKEFRGTALGTFHMSTSLASLPGGLVAGTLWDKNTTYPFVYGTVITVLVIFLFLKLCQYCQEENIEEDKGP